MEHTIRVLPVVAAGIAFMVLGSLWYGPLFAKPWVALMGKSMEEMQKGAKPSTYMWAFGAALLASHVLDYLIGITFTESLVGGAHLGFMAGVGFVATGFGTNALFSQKPFKLYLIDAGYQVVALTVAGAILGAWR